MNFRIFVFSAIPVAILLLFSFVPWGKADERATGSKQAKVTLQVESKPIDRSASLERSSYADVLSKATPAVVGVYTSKIIRYRSNPQSNPIEEFLRRYYGLPPANHARDKIEQEKVNRKFL